MHVRIGPHTVDVAVTFTVKLNLQLQPGLWVVREDDCDYSVTSLQGVIDSTGAVHFAYPKGVARRPGGAAWSAREKLLTRVLPTAHPNQAWAAVPAAVHDVIEDAYLLARDETPDVIGH